MKFQIDVITFKLPVSTRHHIQNAILLELARMAEIQMSIGPDGEWPEGYDANDWPLYWGLLRGLIKLEDDEKCEFTQSGKFLHFLVMSIRDYVAKFIKNLSYKDYVDLRAVYLSDKSWGKPERFPPWPEAEPL
jgi:hypothetical protein